MIVLAADKLVKEMGENEQQEIMEELSDLDALLPDLEAKVNKQLQYNTTIFNTAVHVYGMAMC